MDWFVHASTGSDSNVGWRTDTPLLTLAKLATVMAPGDRAYLAGTFRENVTFSGGLVNCYIGQWPGQTKYVVRGDTVITGFSASGAGYTKTLAAGLNIKSVVVNWDTRVNQNGLHYGHLTLAADAATALATTNNWFYNSGTGVLSINTGANPSTQTVAWCKGGVNGMNVGACTNTVIDNFKGCLWVDSTAGTGYALIGYGTGNVFRIDRTDDCGYHHAGFVGGNCSYNVIEPSTGGEGVCAGNASGGIPLVFYTDQANQTGNVGRNLRIWASPFLLSDGTTTAHSGTVGGVYSHTNGVQVLNGVTWQNIRITYPYTVGVNSCGVDAGNTTRVTSANEENWQNYGVRAIECKIDGAGAPGLNLNAGMADVRCSYRFAGSGSKAGSNGVLYSTASGVARTRLFDSCEVMFTLDNAGAANFVRGWTNDRWVFLNCSFAEIGTSTNERRMFAPVGSSASIKAKQCIFAYCTSTATFRRFYNGDNYDSTAVSNGVESLLPRVFEDCAYIRVVDTVWSTHASLNTQAEWISAALDAGGQASTTNPFEEPATHCRLKRNHALWTYRDTGTSGHTLLGINNKNWTGTIGAYQMNAAATVNWPSLTGTPPPRINRPKMLIQFQTGATTNAYRIRQDLFDDPQGYIEARLAKCSTAGVRSVVFHTIGGHNATEYYPVYSLKDLPNHIRDAVVMSIDRWREDYGINHFGPYMGAVWYTEASGVTKPFMFPDWEEESVASIIDEWRDTSCDTIDFDATANRVTDLYSGDMDDQYNTLGGFAYHFCGMIPTGEALPLDNPSSPTDFDATTSTYSEYLVTQEYYDDNAGLQTILDDTLPVGRAGYHWIYYDAEFDTVEAQARVNQGYIVGAWDDMAQADLNWIGSQTATAGTPGDQNNQGGTDIDPPVPVPPSDPIRNRPKRITLLV